MKKFISVYKRWSYTNRLFFWLAIIGLVIGIGTYFFWPNSNDVKVKVENSNLEYSPIIVDSPNSKVDIEVIQENKLNDRHINDTIKKQIDDMLNKYSGSTARIQFTTENAEALAFSQELTSYIISKGLDVEGPYPTMFFGTTTEKQSMFISEDGILTFQIRNNSK